MIRLAYVLLILLWRRREVRLLFVRSHYDDERRLGWNAQDHRYQGD